MKKSLLVLGGALAIWSAYILTKANESAEQAPVASSVATHPFLRCPLLPLWK